jgi:acyl-CoA thioesterase FadM
MKLIKTDRLAASSCGADVKLSVEGAFRIVEDMVTELMGDQHIDGVTCMREYGGMWVFVRNRIEMPQPLARMDEYTATSYISSFSKIRLYIDTVLQKADGSIALKSRLELCAVDLETGKIRKSESVGVGEKTPAEEPMFEIAYTKEKPVRGDLIDEITVRSADIDYCHHTNNVAYVRYFVNQTGVDELLKHPVRTIEVQYAAQTHEGDKLSVYRCNSENEAFVIEQDGAKVVSCIITR